MIWLDSRILANTMFVFFSNRLGCAGSIAVSLAGTVLLILLIRSCSGYSTF